MAARIDTSYLNLPPTPVKDFNDFLDSGLPEIPKLKSLVTSIKGTFRVSNANLQLYFIEGRVYRVDVFKNQRKRDLVSSIYYVTSANQVHIYDNNEQMLLASERKKVVYSTIPFTLDFLGAADKLRNVILSI